MWLAGSLLYIRDHWVLSAGRDVSSSSIYRTSSSLSLCNLTCNLSSSSQSQLSGYLLTSHIHHLVTQRLAGRLCCNKSSSTPYSGTRYSTTVQKYTHSTTIYHTFVNYKNIQVFLRYKTHSEPQLTFFVLCILYLLFSLHVFSKFCTYKRR